MPRRGPSRPTGNLPPAPSRGQRWFDLVHKLLTGAAALAMLVRLLVG